MGSNLIKKGPVETARILELTKNRIHYLSNDIDQTKLFVGQKYNRLSKISHPGKLATLTSIHISKIDSCEDTEAEFGYISKANLIKS